MPSGTQAAHMVNQMYYTTRQDPAAPNPHKQQRTHSVQNPAQPFHRQIKSKRKITPPKRIEHSYKGKGRYSVNKQSINTRFTISGAHRRLKGNPLAHL